MEKKVTHKRSKIKPVTLQPTILWIKSDLKIHFQTSRNDEVHACEPVLRKALEKHSNKNSVKTKKEEVQYIEHSETHPGVQSKYVPGVMGLL